MYMIEMTHQNPNGGASMAQTQTKPEDAAKGTKPKAAKRSFTWKFWVKVTVIIAVALSPLIPTLWGWQLGWIGTSHGSWSMAAHNGIMPGSIVYKKSLSEYAVGDKISFEYKGSADPTENGPSLKLVVAKNSDGMYRVKGMNDLNSTPPCNVKPEDIDGKVVWSQSFLPESYWRWLSMGWSLNSDEISERWHAIFSLRTVGRALTKEGRYRNWVSIQFPPRAVMWSEHKKWLAVSNADGVKIYRQPQRTPSFEVEEAMFYMDPESPSRRFHEDEVILVKTGGGASQMKIDLMKETITTIEAPPVELGKPTKVKVGETNPDYDIMYVAASAPSLFRILYRGKTCKAQGVTNAVIKKLDGAPGTLIYVLNKGLGKLEEGETIEIVLLP